ncbi:MAG: NAD+ synthase [Bacteroidia bacterium]
MKITLAQISYHTGNFELNSQKIIEAIKKAKSEKSDLIVFAELATCGYPARDFLMFNDFINKANQSIEKIKNHCFDIAAVIGSPTTNPVVEGKDLYNSAIFIENGEVKHTIHKTLLPTYDIFDEYRYFEPNSVFKLIEYKGFKIAVTICEDLWNLNANPMYVKTPMDELIKQNPDIVVNIAASPYNKEQIETRKEVLITNATKYKLPIFYVNHIGAQTHLIFDGGSCIVDKNGVIKQELKYFEEDFLSVLIKKYNNDITFDFAENLTKTTPPRNKYNDIENALVLGIKQYFAKLNFKQAIIGLSGGIDSALVAYLAAKALGSSNVLAVMLPSEFSSNHSITDSEKLVQNLKIKSYKIPIIEIYNTFIAALNPYFDGTLFGIAEENMQSRTRAVILMALSNKFGYILLNTSNKSELAVGYGTLYGDMCGGLSVIGDLYKTEVYELCNYINREQEIIPENIITKEPSAELRPNQKDSDSLPPYNLLDAILYQYIEECKGPNQILEMGFDENVVSKVLKLVNMNEWKRWQMPPVLRVSKRAFGPGRRVPISGKYLT